MFTFCALLVGVSPAFAQLTVNVSTPRQLSSDGFAQLDALSENGDLAFTITRSDDGFDGPTRYLAHANGTIRNVGRRPFGTFRFIGDVPYLLVDSQLVAIEAPPSRSILSEGAAGTFFSTDVALLNPAATPVPVTLRYFREGQPEIQEDRTFPRARARPSISKTWTVSKERRSRRRSTRRRVRRSSPSDWCRRMPPATAVISATRSAHRAGGGCSPKARRVTSRRSSCSPTGSGWQHGGHAASLTPLMRPV